jgi:hypothetical protein
MSFYNINKSRLEICLTKNVYPHKETSKEPMIKQEKFENFKNFMISKVDVLAEHLGGVFDLGVDFIPKFINGIVIPAMNAKKNNSKKSSKCHIVGKFDYASLYMKLNS